MTSEKTSLCLDSSAAFWQNFDMRSVDIHQGDICMHSSSQAPMNAKHGITAQERVECGVGTVTVLLAGYRFERTASACI